MTYFRLFGFRSSHAFGQILIFHVPLLQALRFMNADGFATELSATDVTHYCRRALHHRRSFRWRGRLQIRSKIYILNYSIKGLQGNSALNECNRTESYISI